MSNCQCWIWMRVCRLFWNATSKIIIAAKFHKLFLYRHLAHASCLWLEKQLFVRFTGYFGSVLAKSACLWVRNCKSLFSNMHFLGFASIYRDLIATYLDQHIPIEVLLHSLGNRIDNTWGTYEKGMLWFSLTVLKCYAVNNYYCVHFRLDPAGSH